MRATQYLPDIVKLQRSLYDTFHHRLDQATAKTRTIKQFLARLNGAAFIISWIDFSYSTNLLENSRNEYTERIESLKKAWSLVGQKLKAHGKLI